MLLITLPGLPGRLHGYGRNLPVSSIDLQRSAYPRRLSMEQRIVMLEVLTGKITRTCLYHPNSTAPWVRGRPGRIRRTNFSKPWKNDNFGASIMDSKIGFVSSLKQSLIPFRVPPMVLSSKTLDPSMANTSLFVGYVHIHRSISWL